MLKLRVVGAVGLGITTSILVGLAGSYLPYSHARDTITDALAFPGGLIAGLVYPYGVHTGGGAGYRWAVLVWASNVFVYAVFWYACVQLLGYLRKRKHQYDGADLPVRRSPR